MAALPTSHVAIIGAGIGGLSAAAMLAAQGVRVTVIEKDAAPGGKARALPVGDAQIAAGPTVFTLRDVFDDIFAACGERLDDHVTTRPAETIARHAWSMDERLDLFADPARSEEAIGDFAGADAARGYRAMRAEAARIFNLLDSRFIRAGKIHFPPQFLFRVGLKRFFELSAARPYETLWKALGEHFADPRLRQLYGRYATYCGSSPFACPATLMLIAHVEAKGVWLIDGGIAALAGALRDIGARQGATYRFGEAAAQITTENGKASGVVLANGESIAADSVIVNADPAALGAGLLGAAAQRAAGPLKPGKRSFSALVWLGHARLTGFPLKHHNVFFSPDYPREFADLAAGRPPCDPSVYICAQDRESFGAAPVSGAAERFQIIVNAPANGDSRTYTAEERRQCTQAMRNSLMRCGLTLDEADTQTQAPCQTPSQTPSQTPFPTLGETGQLRLLTPQEWAQFLPGTGGAIYGRASHGWAASFLRQGTRTRLKGLYCAGGSTHPGAGVPMAALSGQLAARTVMADLTSTRRFLPVAMAGGISMRSAKTGNTG